jgi:glucosamine-6-phosphate isomerase
MKIHQYPDYPELAAAVCEFVIDHIEKTPHSLLCLAGGDTPVPVYRRLVEAAKQRKVDFQGCRFVGLDEWVGIGSDDSGSCRFLLNQELLNPLGISEERICFFNGASGDLEQECRKIDSFVDKYGPIDFMLLGIGVNGHLGFNEPGSSFQSTAHLVDLQAITCQVGQKYFSASRKLSRGITLGLSQIQQSRTAVLMANGPKKAAIINKFIHSEISEDIPASILKDHPDSHVFIDDAAGSEISKYD